MRRTVHENNKRRQNKTKKETAKTKFQKINNRIKEVRLDKQKIAVVSICLAIIICIIVADNYISLGLVLNKNIDSEDSIQVQLQTSVEKILPFGNEFLVYSKGNIGIYNNYGKNMANIQLEDVLDAEISTCGKYIQIINKDKNIVYVYKNEYEVARIKVEGKIYSGSINEEGTSIIEYYYNGNKITLGVCDSLGNVKYTIRPNNNIIGKYVLSDNSRYSAYTDVDISGISAYTNVNLIDLNNIKENEPNTNTIYSSEGSLAYDIYWDGRDVITRFEDGYVVYNTASNKSHITRIGDTQIVNIGDYAKRYAYTELDNKGNYLLTIRKMKTDKLKTIELEDTPKYFKYEDGVIYVCYSKNIEAYNNSGTKIKNYDSDIVITEPVIFNGGRSLAMAISNKLIMFTI